LDAIQAAVVVGVGIDQGVDQAVGVLPGGCIDEAVAVQIREATQGEATYIVSLEGLAPGWYVLVYEEEGGKGRRWVKKVVVR
jgi:hypothetical protein